MVFVNKSFSTLDVEQQYLSEKNQDKSSYKQNNISSLLNLIIAADDISIAFSRWLVSNRTLSDGTANRTVIRVELAKVIAHIDKILSEAISTILHHPVFQELEAAWRGLYYLVEQKIQIDLEGRTKIKVMDLSWPELSKDVHKAIEFDQSEFFKCIYSNEFDMPGGEPFGVIITNYRISHKPRAQLPFNDIDTLKLISQTAAAAFSPFIAAADPSFLGLNDFKELGRPVQISESFLHSDFIKWRSLRDQEDSRYVGLTLPDILMRTPYKKFCCYSRNRFHFSETIRDPSKDYLWGSSAFAFGSILLRAFSRYGWFAQIRGARRGDIDGGMVTELPYDFFRVSRNIKEFSSSVNVKIGEKVEHELSQNGFISLCHLNNSQHHVFYSNNSIQQTKQYNKVVATVNARISGMLQYILSASRFAHYLKIICRNHVGNFDTAKDCQSYLQSWIHEYTTASDTASFAIKAKYPLKEAKIQVEEVPGRPGNYSCVAHLQPHFQMDQMISSLRLVTELPAK